VSFGLVNVPVELFSAQRPGGVPLRMLGPDGAPLARQYVCPEHDRPLEPDEIVRGYEVAKGRFVVVDDAELEALAPRASRDIDLERFVPREEIDPAYFVRTYYLVPAGAGTPKAYRLLAEILDATGRAGVGRFVMRGKAYAVAVFAEAGILRAETLRFADEVRAPDALGLPEAKKVESARVRKMEKAIEALAKPGLAEGEMRDEEPERLLALARAKRRRGEGVVELPEGGTEEEEAEGVEVVDLTALLKERLRGRRGGARKAAKRAPAPKRSRRAGSGTARSS
jgi:DNA end-binding protein Ku